MSCQDACGFVRIDWVGIECNITKSVLGRHAQFKGMGMECLCRLLKEQCRYRPAIHILLSFIQGFLLNTSIVNLDGESRRRSDFRTPGLYDLKQRHSETQMKKDNEYTLKVL